MKAQRFLCLSAPFEAGLTDLVNQALGQGWELFGETKVQHRATGDVLIQSLVLRIIPSGWQENEVKRIQDTAAKYFGVSGDSMTSISRRVLHAFPRQVAMFLTRELTELSLNQIGRQFNRDHGTILHGCRRVQELIDVDGHIRNQVEALRQECRAAIAADKAKKQEAAAA